MESSDGSARVGMQTLENVGGASAKRFKNFMDNKKEKAAEKANKAKAAEAAAAMAGGGKVEGAGGGGLSDLPPQSTLVFAALRLDLLLLM